MKSGTNHARPFTTRNHVIDRTRALVDRDVRSSFSVATDWFVNLRSKRRHIFTIHGRDARQRFGFRKVPLGDKQRLVDDVFHSVARRYDLMNDLMSGGLHRLWKDRFVGRVKPRPGERILDMAAGTGDVAFRMVRRGASVTVADINADMLEVGRERARQRGIDGLIWQVEDAQSLTFDDRSFDAYTIAFGIRNVTDIGAALREAYRLLDRGGRFYCLEFSTSDWPGFADAYEAYASTVIPRLGKAVAGDEDSYRYLVQSIRRFPRPEAFRRMIADAGFVRTGVEPMLGGLVAIHSGWKI